MVTFKALVVITDCAAATSKAACVEPRARLTTAYEWSRPNPFVGENRTRIDSGPRTETETIPCAPRNTRASPSRVGAATAPTEDQPANAAAGASATLIRMAARRRWRMGGL